MAILKPGMKRFIFLITFITHGYAQVQTWQMELSKAGSDTAKARLSSLIAWDLLKSDLVSCQKYADTAYELSGKTKLIPTMVSSLQLKGVLERNVGHFEQAFIYCNNALQLSIEHNDSLSIATSLSELGSTYSKQNDFTNAHSYYDMSIRLCVMIGNGEHLMKTLGNKALNFDYQGKYDEAIQYYYAALKIGLTVRNDQTIANLKSNLAYLYVWLGKFNEAIRFTKEAYVLFTRLNDQFGIAKVHSNLGTINFYQGHLERALTEYQTSLKFYEQLNNEEGIQADVNNIGGVLASMGRFEESVVWMKRSMALGKKNNNKKAVTNAYVNLSDIYLMMGDFPKAIQYGDTGKIMALQGDLINQLLHAYNNLYRTYLAVNNYKGAFENYEQFIVLRDSIYSMDAAGKTKELEIKYQVDAQQKQLELLEKEEKVRKLEVQQKNYLIAALAGGILFILGLVTIVVVILVSRSQKKEAIFARKKAELEQQALRSQMNPHFIFNSLNSIQRLYVEGKTNDANEYMADFSTLMRKILDNSTKSKIPLKEELNTLQLYLEMEKLRCGDLLEYEIQVDREIDQLNTKVPPMVIQPFVENAIWHGILPKKEKGKVKIELKKTNEGLLCNIEDNGVGISNKHTNHESKGIQLTEQRLLTKVMVKDLSPGTSFSFIIQA